VLLFMYCVMALWMLVAAVLRVVLSLNSGVPVDVLPAITGAFGLLAVVVLVPRLVRSIRNRPKPPSGRMIPVPPGSPPRSNTSSN
jgi:hypothetical protein